MRNALAISRREMLAFFVSPVAYFVITGFLLLAGYFFLVLLGQFNIFLMQAQQQMQFMGPGAQMPNLNQWVVEPYYHTLLVVLVFLIPLLTMRIFAEEKRRGTFELLVTSPLSVGEIVFGKFLGVAAVILVMMLLIFAFPMLLWLICSPGPEVPPIWSGFLGMVLFALGFAAIGMAVSSFTENQIVAAVSSMVTLLLLYVIHSPAQSLGGTAAVVLNSLSPVMEVKDLIRGVISLKSLVYFVSLISVGLFLSLRALEAYRWR